MNLLKITSLGLVFIMLSWAILGITRGHYYGQTGIALSWIALGLGVIILLATFGYAKFLKMKVLIGGVGAVLAIEPFTEVLLIRAFFPSFPPIVLVLVGIGLVVLAVKKL